MKFWILALLFAGYTEGARFLAFFPIQAKSHHFVFRPIMEELGRRGHEVVYYTGFPYDGTVPPGITQIDMKPELPNFHSIINLYGLMNTNIIDDMRQLVGYSFNLARLVLETSSVQKLMHSEEKFDAILMQSYFLQEYQSAFMHKFNAIGIDINSIGDFLWMNELTGLPDNPSYQVDFRAPLTHNMNFRQRLYNTYAYLVTTAGNYYYMNQMERIVSQYFNYTGHESRPPFMEMLSNRSLILVNYHNVVGYPVPKPPHRKDIGGVTIRPNKPLPKAIQTIMDGAPNGVIYFSLGSNVNVSHPINRKMVANFMRVFEGLPQRVLMKWEKSTFDGFLPSNVYLQKWYPQQDILAHNNTVLFITHGGYMSLVETVHYGVPVIGIPYFTDQIKNFHFAEEAGIGKMLKLSEISYSKVSSVVKDLISNKTYKEEMSRRSKVFRDRPIEPVDEAAFWIEHVLKYPDVLKPKALSLSFVQLHLIDVTVFIVAVFIAVVFIIWKSMTILVRIIRWKSTPSKEKRS